MAKTLHQNALALGATQTPAQDVDGVLHPATYTMTLEQLQAVVATHASQILMNASKMLLEVPLSGRIGDWHQAQVQGQAIAESAELLLAVQRASKIPANQQ